MIEETLEKLYWNSQMSQQEVAEELGCSRRTIRYWMEKQGIPRRSRGEGISLHYYKPKLEPSEALSYVLGVLKGDGCVYRSWGEGSIILQATDEVFVDSFNRALKEIGLSPHICICGGYPRGYASSVVFADWYKNLPLSVVKEIVQSDKQFILSFIRGFYESEGSYVVDQKHHHRRADMTNTNSKLLMMVKGLLEELKFHPKIYGPYPKGQGRKDEYRICIHGEEIKQFLKLIKPCIKKGEAR